MHFRCFSRLPMTIDSSWLACMKSDAPDAFTPEPPFDPNGVFIDGQIRLMCPTSADRIQTWDDYVVGQFERCITKYFRAGVRGVVIAFDDYTHVPAAKSMTQIKRRRHLPTVEFSDRSQLPPTVPTGEQWAACISNRTFKTVVIKMVIDQLIRRVPGMLTETQSLIVDYQGPPMEYTRDGERMLDDFESLGEADVKFPRYTKMFPYLQVDSIDGDSVPIALLRVERLLNGGDHPIGTFNVSVKRMVTRIPETSAEKKARAAETAARAEAEASRKRKAGDSDGKAWQPKREYEFLDVMRLYGVLVQNVLIPLRSACGDGVRRGVRGSEMQVLVGAIGLTGTDFTRGVPHVGAKSLYDMLQDLWPKFTSAYDAKAERFESGRYLNGVVAGVYYEKFNKHCHGGNLRSVLSALRESKLSERTKGMLPDLSTLECTANNVNWLLQYWLRACDDTTQQYPDPVQECYGYKCIKGKVGFVA